MSFKPFRKIRVAPNEPITPKNINDVQDNISEAISQMLNKDQLDSTVIKNINLQPGIINKIPHNLGRNLIGYIVTRTHNGYAFLQDFQDTNPSPNLLLYLQVPAQCTIDLLVF